MLNEIEKVLRDAGLVGKGWAEATRVQGRRVAKYRRYYEGEHDVKLSRDMQDMLRSDDGFSDNYCELVVNTMADRLLVRSITSDEAGSENETDAWAEALMVRERFDALQLDVHQACIRDGDTYVLSEYDEATGEVKMHHEAAFDGEEGMLVVYDRLRRRIVVAIKVWYELSERRVNFYYADRVVKYEATGELPLDEAAGGVKGVQIVGGETVGGKLKKIGEDIPWLAGQVPVSHFKNRAGSRRVNGSSELTAVVPLQDVLNRVVTSMVMTGELNAFQIRVAKGFDPPERLAPGMWVVITGDNGVLGRDDQADAYTLEAGEVIPFIDQANFIIEQMATISLTPLPKLTGGAAGESGEAMKERKEGMIGKINRSQVRLGNAWEDLMRLAVTIQNAYGTSQVDAAAGWTVNWKPAEVRDTAEVLAKAQQMHEWGYEAEALRLLGYDGGEIKRLMEEKQAAASNAMAALGAGLPGFEQFGVPVVEEVA